MEKKTVLFLDINNLFALSRSSGHVSLEIIPCIFFSETAYPAYVENTPAVSYITDETGRQIAVVPLDKEVDHSKVYVNTTSDDEEHDNDVDNEEEEEEEGDDSLEETDHIDDDNNDDDDDDDDDDGDDDDSDDYIPKNHSKSTHSTVTVGDDSFNDADYVMGESSHSKKQKSQRKRKPNIKEITAIDADTGVGKFSPCVKSL